MLSGYSRLDRRYLSGFMCGLCEQRLDRASCGSIFGPRCSEEVREKRRRDCLMHYKPRPTHHIPDGETG